jgi:hypothetical protein
MSESNKEANLVKIELPTSEVSIIDANCINCNKRFKSMRAVSMHLRMTAKRHAVNFINYGIYDKKTGTSWLLHPFMMAEVIVK